MVAQETLDAVAANTARADDVIGNEPGGAAESGSAMEALTRPDPTVRPVAKGRDVSVRTLP